jgi:histidyl-tRNA synthetase
MPNLISPLTGAASGFPEYTPAQQRAFEAAVAKIKTVYESFGFTPLETSAVERIATLESKGISSKEVYGLRRLAAESEDGSAKELALRFDLTVPLARYVVANQAQLVFPFRRYQVQPVWRGERAQAGRYRQFYQFDIDTLGDGSLPLAADAEVLAAGFRALEALGAGDFTLRVNNRKLLQGLLAWAGFADRDAAIKLIDDAEKAGWEKTEAGLNDLGGKARELCRLLRAGSREALRELDLNAEGKAGLEELSRVMELATALLGRTRSNAEVKADLTIARGLDYYTGTVVETVLHGAPQLGSVMSGGRYDDLAANLGKKQMPGVGISIGLSRLMAYLLTLPAYHLPATPAALLVACPDEAQLPQLAALAQELRGRGLKVEQQLGGKEPLGKQLQKAQERGLKWAVTGLDGDQVTLRDLTTRAEQTLPPDQIAATLK